MLTKRIIPCLDVDNGRVVKGVQFIDIKDAGDPVEIAKKYDQAGADEIVFLDITASSENRSHTFEVVHQVAKSIFIPLTVGGGVRSLDDAKKLLALGADKVAINSAAIKNPDLLRQCADSFGSQCIVLAIDAKKNYNSWNVYSYGGRVDTQIDAINWAIKGEEMGAGEILLTSMDGDGSLQGYDLELTKKVSQSVQIPVIASGGVGNLDHLVDGIVKGKADAVLAASIFHFGTYSIAEAKNYLIEKKISIRS